MLLKQSSILSQRPYQILIKVRMADEVLHVRSYCLLTSVWMLATTHRSISDRCDKMKAI